MALKRNKLAAVLAEGRRAAAVAAYQKRFSDEDCVGCPHKPRSDSDYNRKRNCRYCRGEEDD